MARMMMKNIRRELLLALLNEYEEFAEPDDSENPAINVIGVAKHAKIDVPLRELRLCIERFSQEGLVIEDEVSEWSNGEYYCYLTARGIEEAEAFKQISSQENSGIVSPNDVVEDWMLDSTSTAQASTAPSFTTFGFASDSAPFGSGTFADNQPAPASDRFVSAKDNQEAITQIQLKIADLIKAVEDNRENDFEDKEGLLGELLAFDLLLQQPQISVPLVEKILSETVKYLAAKFAEHAIGLAANAVLIAAAALFGYSL